MQKWTHVFDIEFRTIKLAIPAFNDAAATSSANAIFISCSHATTVTATAAAFKAEVLLRIFGCFFYELLDIT